MKSLIRKFLVFFFSFLFIVVFAIVFQKLVLSDAQRLNEWMVSFGYFAILIYIPIQIITIVVAPIGGYTPQLILYGIFGPLIGSIIVYCVVTPIYLINFYLARRYGLNIIRRLIGQKAATKTSRYMEFMNSALLIFLRMQPAIFDYVAYSAGLTTRITYSRFLLVNVFAGLLTIPITYLVFTYTDSFTVGVALHFSLSFLAVVIFSIISGKTKWR